MYLLPTLLHFLISSRYRSLSSLSGVMRNIRHLTLRDRSKTWGAYGWKKVVVCIVADGRKKIHPRTLALLTAMGCYQEGYAKNMVNGKEVMAHIYEYTTQGELCAYLLVHTVMVLLRSHGNALTSSSSVC